MTKNTEDIDPCVGEMRARIRRGSPISSIFVHSSFPLSPLPSSPGHICRPGSRRQCGRSSVGWVFHKNGRATAVQRARDACGNHEKRRRRRRSCLDRPTLMKFFHPILSPTTLVVLSCATPTRNKSGSFKSRSLGRRTQKAQFRGPAPAQT